MGRLRRRPAALRPGADQRLVALVAAQRAPDPHPPARAAGRLRAGRGRPPAGDGADRRDPRRGGGGAPDRGRPRPRRGAARRRLPPHRPAPPGPPAEHDLGDPDRLCAPRGVAVRGGGGRLGGTAEPAPRRGDGGLPGRHAPLQRRRPADDPRADPLAPGHGRGRMAVGRARPGGLERPVRDAGRPADGLLLMGLPTAGPPRAPRRRDGRPPDDAPVPGDGPGDGGRRPVAVVGPGRGGLLPRGDGPPAGGVAPRSRRPAPGRGPARADDLGRIASPGDRLGTLRRGHHRRVATPVRDARRARVDAGVSGFRSQGGSMAPARRDDGPLRGGPRPALAQRPGRDRRRPDRRRASGGLRPRPRRRHPDLPAVEPARAVPAPVPAGVPRPARDAPRGEARRVRAAAARPGLPRGPRRTSPGRHAPRPLARRRDRGPGARPVGRLRTPRADAGRRRADPLRPPQRRRGSRPIPPRLAA